MKSFKETLHHIIEGSNQDMAKKRLKNLLDSQEKIINKEKGWTEKGNIGRELSNRELLRHNIEDIKDLFREIFGPL